MNRTAAKDLLVHYFSTVWKKAGLNWTGDNVVEVESIVDRIVNAAVSEITAATQKKVDRVEPVLPAGDPASTVRWFLSEIRRIQTGGEPVGIATNWVCRECNVLFVVFTRPGGEQFPGQGRGVFCPKCGTTAAVEPIPNNPADVLKGGVG